MRRRTRYRSPDCSGTVSLAIPFGDFADGGDDVGVSGAAANIAAHAFGDFGIGEGRHGGDIHRRPAWPARLVLGDECDSRADLAGRAVPALESVMTDERGLHRMERAVLCQAFDGGDLVAVMHHRERQAALDALAVHEDGAGAALSLVAALLRAGQRDMLAQRIEQRGTRIEIEVIISSIDRESYLIVRHSFRRRLPREWWSSERQACGPSRLEEASPGCVR